MATRRPQKGKDGKRPRRFHRGRAQGKINDQLLQRQLEPAYRRAETEREQTSAASEQARAEIDDHRALMVQLDRVAPFVPHLAPLPAVRSGCDARAHGPSGRLPRPGDPAAPRAARG